MISAMLDNPTNAGQRPISAGGEGGAACEQKKWKMTEKSKDESKQPIAHS